MANAWYIEKTTVEKIRVRAPQGATADQVIALYESGEIEPLDPVMGEVTYEAGRDG